MAHGERSFGEKLTKKLFWSRKIKADYKELTKTRIPFRGKDALAKVASKIKKHEKDVAAQTKRLKASKARAADKSLSEKDRESFRNTEVDFYEGDVKKYTNRVKKLKELAQKIRDHIGA
ncbi:MAG: hypothetical protein KAW41_04325 [Candidatus Diapherotrites archaeon]|nr:hypothetical protein [Candidatus Diapherotrites archaeon]